MKSRGLLSIMLDNGFALTVEYCLDYFTTNRARLPCEGFVVSWQAYKAWQIGLEWLYLRKARDPQGSFFFWLGDILGRD